MQVNCPASVSRAKLRTMLNHPNRRASTLLGALGVLLWITPASAQHAVAFDFVSPAGAGNYLDGGFTVIRWIDHDMAGTTTAGLYASRRAYSPFQEPDAGGDFQITTADLSVNNPLDEVQWDARNVPAGCYQPYAILRPNETFKRGIGNLTVFTAGQNVPPSVWLTNPAFDQPTAAGLFTVHYRVDDPDDLSHLTVKYLNASDETTGVIAASIPIPRGGAVGSVAFDVKTVPNAYYFIYAEVTSDDGRRCDVYSAIPFTVTNPYDGGEPPSDAGDPGDAGEHAGHGDAGDHSDAGDHGGHRPVAPSGCGCAGAPGIGWLGLLALVRAALRRSPARSRDRPTD